MKPEEIKALRKRLGITTDRLGTLLGVRGDTVRHWECGARRPGEPTVRLMRIIERERMKPREDA